MGHERNRDTDHADRLMVTFGDNLRLARKALHLSQRALADIIGIPQKTIYAVETGRNSTIRTMARIAAAVDGEVPAMLTAKIIE